MKKSLNKTIKVGLLPSILLILGFVCIIIGLIIIIYWQRGFIQIRWLECPKQEMPIA